jgi:phospholipase C
VAGYFAGCLALAPQPSTAAAVAPSKISKIKHVIIIMQENRSFDHYFGKFPGADGIPPGTCIPDPSAGTCAKPFHSSKIHNLDAPHGHPNFEIDYDNGLMDGFVRAYERMKPGTCAIGNGPQCTIEVMGWHDAREIPNYWIYAENFVLQDRMFESSSAYSGISHLYMVSEWSAICTNAADPLSCTSFVGEHPGWTGTTRPSTGFGWTDLTWLLHRHSVSWGYYVVEGTEPDCLNPEILSCSPAKLTSRTNSLWNPLRFFTTVKRDGELENIQTVANFYAGAYASGCGLPSVSWVVPSIQMSDHPPNPINDAQAYVTSLVNAVMSGDCWASSAIFIAWDDWGGFYDHVPPPQVDFAGYGFRVPGLMISPWAKKGIDHQTLTFDSYNRLIEDLFLGGQRLNPATDGRPDHRPDVRETLPGLGDLMAEFDFTQTPRPRRLLPEYPASGPASVPDETP